MRFEELQLVQPLLQALAECGYDAPTPIQAQTIPLLLAGRDVIASAQTGTGKTAAFILPALQRLAAQASRPAAKRRGAGVPRVLVLAPTRELAQQVATQSTRYGQNLHLRTVCLFGGAPYPPQNRELERGVDVLVATPGRLIDHIERGRVDLSRLQILVLDEADRMLDMGFQEDVDRICALAPAARQTVLFSATIDGAIGRLAARLRASRCASTSAPSGSAPLAIEQRVHFADDRAHKYRLLDRLLADVGAGAEHHLHRDQARRRGAGQQAAGRRPYGGCAAWRHAPARARPHADDSCAAAACGRWWPPTSRPAASTCRGSRRSSISTCRGRPRTMCIASAAPGAPARRALPCRLPTRLNAARCARSSAIPARRFRRMSFRDSSRVRAIRMPPCDGRSAAV